ncbi:Alpha/Beta hydrolase protein [Aspergillus insuetus]
MLVLLSIVALASASACTPTYNLRTTAIINSGALVGTTTQVSTPSATAPVTVNKYLGVPFTNKPGRFRLAEPVPPWTDFFDASKNGPGCHEAISEDAYWYANGAGLGLLSVEENEECLNLNVFTPATASAGSKPVLVWIYGGSWQDGGNSYDLYDGSNIVANQDVVVVAINYRMNVFGFPADHSIPTIEPLLTTPPLEPLPFRAATMTSGLLSVHRSVGNPSQPPPRMTSPSPATLARTGSQGRPPKCLFLTGTPNNESSPLVYGQTNISATLELIGLSENHDRNARIVRITSDILMHCSHHVFSNETRSILGSPVWRFLLNASFPNTEFFPGAGAYHAMEIQFFFGTYRQENTTDFQREVTRVMQKGYMDFAKYPTQGPGCAQVPEIGIFKDGVTPYISDEGRRAFSVVESEVLDRRCGRFYDLFDMISFGNAEE